MNSVAQPHGASALTTARICSQESKARSPTTRALRRRKSGICWCISGATEDDVGLEGCAQRYRKGGGEEGGGEEGGNAHSAPAHSSGECSVTASSAEPSTV